MLVRALRMAESTALLCALWSTSVVLNALVSVEERRRAQARRLAA